MKVFVLFTQQVFDCENSESIRLFATKEGAKAAFDKFVRKEKRNAEDNEWEVELDEMEFCAYEDGRYSENRVVAFIVEQEVEEEKKKSYYDRCYDFKMEVMQELRKVLGGRTVDVEDYGYNVLVQEHIAGAQFEAGLESISADGFVADGEEFILRDMNLDDLCVILDKLVSGEW